MDGRGAGSSVLHSDDARWRTLVQTRAHDDGVAGARREYKPASAVPAWHETIRPIEELINAPLFTIDDEALVASCSA